MSQYYIKLGKHPEQEVSKEEFISMEHQCGFFSKFGPDKVATAGFGLGIVSGRVDGFDDELEELKALQQERGE